MCVYISVYIYFICMFECMYVCVYIYTCTVYIYIYTYTVCIHTHTHTLRYLAYFVFLDFVSCFIQDVCLIVTLNKAGLSCRNTLCTVLSRDIFRA